MSCAAFGALLGASVLYTGWDVRASDKFVLAPINAHEAVLCYENANPPKSRYDSWDMEVEGVAVRFNVHWTSGAGEHVTVFPPDGYIVYPDREAIVIDGESFTFYIMRAAS